MQEAAQGERKTNTLGHPLACCPSPSLLSPSAAASAANCESILKTNLISF